MFDAMHTFVPDAERLSKIFASATAPTFFLGAVAAFASLMTSKINGIMDRVRTLNAIADTDQERAHLKADLDRLMRRIKLLKDGLQAVLTAGVFATLLLAVLFGTEFMGLEYAYGAGSLFMIATFLLGYALFKFAQEARISIDEADKY
jgi:hypothetical protein